MFLPPFLQSEQRQHPLQATSLRWHIKAFVNGVLPTYECLNALLWASITIFRFL